MRMKLEDLTVMVRPRHSWEAADLGCALVRRDFPRILASWAITVVPLWGVLAAILWNYPTAFVLMVWWLKPLYDRVPLFFLSRSNFGAKPGMKEILKAWPGLWAKFLGPALIWRRLSPIRSFALPVWMLEGVRDKTLRQRVEGLASEGGGSGTTLTLAFVHLEIAVYFGLLALVNSFAPESGIPPMSDLVDMPDPSALEITHAFLWWSNLWYLVTVSLIEPFYVGAGFGLYLNSRSKLEGWDIEIAFRKLARRLSAQPVMNASVAILLSFWIAGECRADEVPNDGNELVQQILKNPDFEVHRKVSKVWVPTVSSLSGDNKMWELFLGIVGYGIMGIAIVALIVLLIRSAGRWRFATRVKSPETRRVGPQAIMGMDIRAASLPNDILAAAQAAWLAGAYREALSLLYRGTLLRLVESRVVTIEDGDTEQDCLSRVETAREGPEVTFFGDLTRKWIQLAYGSEPLSEADFQSLCRRWPFAASRRKSPNPVPTAVVAILALMLLNACSGEWQEYDREVGYKGKARLDPFLAAQQFLDTRGFTTERRPNLYVLPEPSKGLLFVSAEGGMSAGHARQLLDWVKQGGHLVYSMSGMAAYNDWGILGSLSGGMYFGSDDRPDPILTALEVTIEGGKAGNASLDESEAEDDGETKQKSKGIQKEEDVPVESVELRWQGKTLKLELTEWISFELKRALRRGEYRAGFDGKNFLLSLRRGSGRVTLLNHARPLRNRHLGTADHGRLLDALAGDSPGQAWFVLGMEGSFLGLLWDRGWRVMLGLAFLIAFWLWLTVPRFGPLRQVATQETKRFADHLNSLGFFFHQIRRHDVLILAAQEALMHRLKQSFPHIGSSDTTTMEKFLQLRSRLPLERVRSALAEAQTHSPRLAVEQLQDLQTLRLSLS